MAKRKWSIASALAILGEMVFPDQKVVYLNGKATLSQCSAADYLAKEHHYYLA